MYIRVWDGLGPNAQSRMFLRSTLGQPYAATKRSRGPVRHFACSDDDRKKIERIVGKGLSKEELGTAVGAAVERAVSLSLKAAHALESSPRSIRTKTIFREIFGIFPEFAPAWRAADAPWKDRGELVGLRLKRAAGILGSGQIQYYCWGCPGGDRDPITYEACNYPPGKYIIGFGKGFWVNLKQAASAYDYMAMALLHEALHIYYPSVITKKHEGRYGNAYCYQRFVSEMNRLYLYPETEKACSSILRRGSRGPEVRKLQKLLNNWITRFPSPDKPSVLTATGVFDHRTETAVRIFQRIASLKEKGVVGSGTWRELLKHK